MTVLSIPTANASENGNVASRVQVWLNEIVEAFGDGNCERPIKAVVRSPNSTR
jgi:hypothetical protein